MDHLLRFISLVQRDDTGTATEQAVKFSFYHYNPTKAGAVIFALLFFASTLMHLVQLWRTRCWFVIPLILGSIFESIGYCGRVASADQSPNWTLGPYVVQTLLLLVAPALFAATIYMELGKIILFVDGETRSLIPKKWMTKIFVTGDVLSFVLQGAGGGIQSSGTLEALETGTHIIVGGLFVQLIFFGIFILIAVAFHLKIREAPTTISASGVPWKRHMLALYAASGLIMVRSVFRLVEYLQGFDGYLLYHEVYLYIFDAALMFLTLVLLNVVHPSEIAKVMRSSKGTSYGFELGQGSRHHRLGSTSA
ncbi:RTA1 like protein-domain-containing protein [Ilyonectria destructans]|nr:RTA1 like protein-domain-containing protein [Ilyonectria destructans]